MSSFFINIFSCIGRNDAYAALTYGTLAQREHLLVTSLAYDLSSVGVISSDTAKDIDKKATHILEVRKEGINAAMQK